MRVLLGEILYGQRRAPVGGHVDAELASELAGDLLERAGGVVALEVGVVHVDLGGVRSRAVALGGDLNHRERNRAEHAGEIIEALAHAEGARVVVAVRAHDGVAIPLIPGDRLGVSEGESEEGDRGYDYSEHRGHERVS